MRRGVVDDLALSELNAETNAESISKSIALGTVLAACMVSGLVHAAQPSAEALATLSLEELGRVKITAASLFAHSDLDTPSSITVVTEEEWQRDGARHATDPFNRVASMYTIPLVFGVRGVSIRGLPLEGHAGVLTSLDGVPLVALTGAHVFEFGLGTLQSMELLRGPGSALHGSDAFHGVMVLHTFQAQQDMASANAFVASDGLYQSTARFSRALQSIGRASVAVAFDGQPDQSIPYSFSDPVSGVMLSGERENRFDSQSLSLNLNSDSEGPWSYKSGVYVHRYNAQGFQGFGTVASGERDVSDLQAKFAVARLSVDREIAQTGMLSVGGYYWKVGIDNARFQKTAGVFTQALATVDQHRTGVRVVYKHDLGERTQLGVGINYAEQGIDKATSTLLSDSGTVIRSIDQVFDDAKRSTRSAMFEGNTALITNLFSVTYGGRYDSYSDVDSHFSPRLGFVYRPQHDVAVKLLYGHAFRAPGVIETLGATGSIQGAPDIDAETFDTVELVYLKQSTDWRLQLSAFHSELQDAIANVPNGTPPPALRVANLGETTADGAELEWRIEKPRWYSLLNSTYVRTHNNWSGAYTTIPKWVVAVGVGYRWAGIADVSIAHRLQSHVDDAVTNSAFAPTQLPAYQRTDLQIEKRFADSFKLWGTVRNLFARNNRLPSSPAAQLGVPQEKINVGVGIRYDW